MQSIKGKSKMRSDLQIEELFQPFMGSKKIKIRIIREKP